MAIRCSCGKGELKRSRLARRDVGELFGLDAGQLIVMGAPALVCSACGGVSFDGEVLETITTALVRDIVDHGEVLRPREVSFLRGELSMTQTELADRLGVSRATIARWESGETDINRGESLALRSLVAAEKNETKLLREIAAPQRPVTRTAVPYHVAI